VVPIMQRPFYGALTDDDALALARYIKSLPPIKNAVPRPHGATEKPSAPYLTVVTPKP
jgi:hypothetical protein